MTSVTSARLCWTLLAASVVVLASEDEDVVTPEVGQTVTLTCRAPTGGTIQAVKWSRGDPGDQYVLLFQDGRLDPGNQHPSFKNRVDLQDRQMKDGDVSLILKDVMTDDDGAYECQVLVGTTRSWETISISYLSVDPAGSGGLSDGGMIWLRLALVFAGFVVGCACCAGCAGFLIYIEERCRSYNSV